MRDIVGRLIVLAALALGACAPPVYRAELMNTAANAPYVLGSGDRLRVIVFGQDSLSNSYNVDGAGDIAMPLIGTVRAAGQTTQSLERGIEAKLRNGFLREPRVAAEVEAYRPFYVIGEVTTAGQYPFVNGMTVQNAIAIAGGYTPRGWNSGADVTRIIDGVSVTGTVPLTYPLRPGDTVTVRERFL
jgi:polysaccharide export outer membrane protein